jgi:hypothetical protein
MMEEWFSKFQSFRSNYTPLLSWRSFASSAKPPLYDSQGVAVVAHVFDEPHSSMDSKQSCMGIKERPAWFSPLSPDVPLSPAILSQSTSPHSNFNLRRTVFHCNVSFDDA